MSETIEMMFEGVLCATCGATMVMEDIFYKSGGKIEGDKIVSVPGFPLKCEDCEKES